MKGTFTDFLGWLEATYKLCYQASSMMTLLCPPVSMIFNAVAEVVESVYGILRAILQIVGGVLGMWACLLTFLVGSCCWRFRKTDHFFVLPMHVSRALLAFERAFKLLK